MFHICQSSLNVDAQISNIVDNDASFKEIIYVKSKSLLISEINVSRKNQKDSKGNIKIDPKGYFIQTDPSTPASSALDPIKKTRSARPTAPETKSIGSAPQSW